MLAFWLICIAFNTFIVGVGIAYGAEDKEAGAAFLIGVLLGPLWTIVILGMFIGKFLGRE